MSSSSSHDQNLPLAVLILLGQIVLSIGIGAAVKSISAETAFLVIMSARYLFSLPLLAGYGVYQRGIHVLHVTQIGVLAARCCAGLAGLVSYLYAVIHLNLSLATVLSQTMSLFITLLAPVMLKEKVGIRRMSGIAAGFAGVLIVLNPGSEIFSSYSTAGVIAGLFAPFCGALMFIFLRKLGTRDEPVSTALWYNFSGACLFTALFVLSEDNLPPVALSHISVWLILIAIGVASSVQQFMMARSHQLADASTLAPVHYASVPLSMIAGITLFSDPVGIHFIIGTTIIIGASWYILKREQQLKKQGKL